MTAAGRSATIGRMRRLSWSSVSRLAGALVPWLAWIAVVFAAGAALLRRRDVSG